MHVLGSDPPAPKLGPFKLRIEAILADDAQAPRKQRHFLQGVVPRG